jgi:hypothetical protein
MINYDDYPGEQTDCDFVDVQHSGCSFRGDFLQRRDGTFDFALNRENSELEGLEAARITWLRQQAGGEPHLLVEHIAESELDESVRKRVAERFVGWLEANLGLQPGRKAKVRWSGEKKKGWWR